MGLQLTFVDAAVTFGVSVVCAVMLIFGVSLIRAARDGRVPAARTFRRVLGWGFLALGLWFGEVAAVWLRLVVFRDWIHAIFVNVAAAAMLAAFVVWHIGTRRHEGGER